MNSINIEINGRELIAMACHNNGLIYDEVLILGIGEKVGKRCEFSISTQNIETRIFAVKYFKNEDLFVAWNLKNPNLPSKRTKFSLKASVLNDISLDKVNHIEKHNQFNGWGKEIVYVFKPNIAEHFVKEYIVKRLK